MSARRWLSLYDQIGHNDFHNLLHFLSTGKKFHRSGNMYQNRNRTNIHKKLIESLTSLTNYLPGLK